MHTIVVGGTRGIGHVLANMFHDQGQVVSVIGRKPPHESTKSSSNLHYWFLDLTNKGKVASTLREIVDKNGKVNNLIFFQRYRGTENDWHGELDVSLTATKDIIDSLVENFDTSINGKASIVIVNSMASRFIAQEQPLSYHVAKAGLTQITNYYAVSLGKKGIRVNSVTPGAVLKEESKDYYVNNEKIHDMYKKIIPIGRMVTAEDIAKSISFLCSDQASAITGHNIVVDGGLSLSWHESLARSLASLDNSAQTKRSDLIRRRKTCRLCDSSDLGLVLQLVHQPIGDIYIPPERLNVVQENYPVDLFLCNTCGHSQLLDVIDPNTIYGNYIYLTSSSLGLVEHFHKYAYEIMNKINPAQGSLVVDIGSNDGVLLEAFKKYGMKVLGVEPAKHIAKDATERGIETLPNFFTIDLAKEINKKYGPATVVTANNVFSNVDDLTSFTTGVRELLAQDGVFICEIFYLADLINNLVFDYIYHEHLDYHSVKPLNAFFQRLGMEIIDIRRIPTKCGSLRLIAQLSGGQRTKSSSIQELIEFEEHIGLHKADIFRTFKAKIEKIKQELIPLLENLQDRGKTVAAFGASITCTALTYDFGLHNYFSFIVDDNPTRQHLFSPGLHIPVLPPQAIYDRNIDYVLILAWRYTEPIMQKHKSFLERGGHFIIPLPEVKII